MNDIDNRQAYVFLDCSPESKERTQKGDEWFAMVMGDWRACPIDSQANEYIVVRRPVAQPQQQAYKLTVWDEYAKIAYEKNIDTHSAEHCAEVAKAYADEMMKARAK